MELFKTSKYYIFRQGEHSLWCSRQSGRLEPKSAWDLTAADDPTCLGLVHGIVGKIPAFPDSDPHLLVIESCSLVGYVWNKQPIFKINKIGLLGLGPREPEITTQSCSKHNSIFGQRMEDNFLRSPQISKQQEALAKTWGSIKSATKSLKTSTVQAANRIGKDNRDSGAKKILDEVEKMFTQSDSFYLSPGVDLTNSVQRLGENYQSSNHSWHTANDRFFWNKFLLKDLIDLKDPKADPWIVPVLHGYVHFDSVPVELDGVLDVTKQLKLMLVSRRSRFRAGTRYKRRGVDDNGNVANYVETEQCLIFGDHVLSFVQVRGSVPVYWSQPGFKYRPPPQIDRGAEETRLAFQRHFEKELCTYGNQCIVSLVEQVGKEKVVGEAFTDQIVHLNEPRLTYILFDFHEHCRGMRFENVARLVGGIEDVLNEMKYTWIDSHGIICQQQSTFRVNCMDCLDRTNVCQTAFAKYMLENQLSKLGILPPEGLFWPALKTAFNVMWANNGDIISRQYAGTNALKGDFTRTGERRFAGMMKDGMNSANRYYLNRFKDTLKQTAIDVTLGNIQPEEALSVLTGQSNISDEDEEVVLQTADRVRQVIDDCRKQFVSDDEIIIGSWGLVDAHPSTGDPSQIDMDVILLLSRDQIYLVSYDDETDQVRGCRQHLLSSIVRIEVGSESRTSSLSSAGVNFLKSPKKEAQSSALVFMRLHVRHPSGDNETLQFRSTKLRFFNNMAVPICKAEEMNESVKAIAETIHVTMEIAGLSIPYAVGTLDKFPKASSKQMEVPLPFPRNASEGQLSAIKSVGNKALSSVTSQFSKLKAPMTITRSATRSENKQASYSKERETDSKSSSPEPEHSALSDQPCVVRDVLHSPWAGVLFLATSSVSSPPSIASPAVIEPPHEKPHQPKVLLRCISAGQFETHRILRKSHEKTQTNGDHIRLIVTPEILVNAEAPSNDDFAPKRSRQRSHSSAGRGQHTEEPPLPRATSDISIGSQGSAEIKNSKSDFSGFGTSVLSSFGITSPEKFSNILASQSSANKANPLAMMFAKGVQNLGANLDPRKMLDAKREQPKPKNEEDPVLCSNTRIIRL